jgi:hypothetical protein
LKLSAPEMPYSAVKQRRNVRLALKLALLAAVAHRVPELPPRKISASDQRHASDDLQERAANVIDRACLGSRAHLIHLRGPDINGDEHPGKKHHGHKQGRKNQ